MEVRMNFVELCDDELYMIDGGKHNWLKIIGGGLIVGGSIASGGGLAVVAIGVASGVGTIIDGI